MFLWVWGSQFNAYSRLKPYLLLYQILSHMLTCLQSLPSFLRNLDLLPSCHVAPRCSSPPSPELPWCPPAIHPKLFSLSDNIYVDWVLAQGSHKHGMFTNTVGSSQSRCSHIYMLVFIYGHSQWCLLSWAVCRSALVRMVARPSRGFLNSTTCEHRLGSIYKSQCPGQPPKQLTQTLWGWDSGIGGF